IEGNESVGFCWEVTALLKPLAIDSTPKLQQTTLKFSRFNCSIFWVPVKMRLPWRQLPSFLIYGQGRHYRARQEN
ncbi:hypothetical protein QT976_28885, partial [Microcoleus sp. w2-18aC6]|uniref:hypothetical protein n=1 Tax=Microcoleus sp. w2-18aC6 TaxID=2818997 RepID=UPI002FD7822B